MGRRSINTTKSGKFMNPTDQASKKNKNLLKNYFKIIFNFNRKGSSQEGIKEKQEAAPVGEASCAQK